MMDFMTILVKGILKTFINFNDGFCLMMDFPFELFILVKQVPEVHRNLHQDKLKVPANQEVHVFTHQLDGRTVLVSLGS